MNNIWVVFCRGSSIKNMIPELQAHFSGWDNAIAVNSAANTFETPYWCILDSNTFYAHPKLRNKKIVTTRLCASRIKNKFSKQPIHHIGDCMASNSGIYAIRYAFSQGATKVITCGFDLTDSWEYFNGKKVLPRPSYAKLMRDSFRRIGRNIHNIYSVDRNNSLKLKFYDITKGEFNG